MSKKGISLLIAGAAALFAAAMIAGLSLAPQPPPQPMPVSTEQNQTATVSVMIDTGADILGFNQVEIRSGATVWTVLEELNTKEPALALQSDEYKDLGRLVKSIKGLTNGADGRYWQYWVNNRYAAVAADKQAVQDGDVIMWKFTGGEFKEY